MCVLCRALKPSGIRQAAAKRARVLAPREARTWAWVVDDADDVHDGDRRPPSSIRTRPHRPLRHPPHLVPDPARISLILAFSASTFSVILSHLILATRHATLPIRDPTRSRSPTRYSETFYYTRRPRFSHIRPRFTKSLLTSFLVCLILAASC